MASLDTASEERKEYEDPAKSSSINFLETENMIEVLQNELKLAKGKLESIEQDFKVSSIRESEIMEKLISAEEQVGKQRRIIEQAAARNSELELLHEFLAKGSEIKLREAKESFIQALRDLEWAYQGHVNDECQIVASLRAELAESSVKLVYHEKTINELKSEVLEAETRSRQSSSENEWLVGTNLKLRQELKTHQIKINELQEQLNASNMEKDVTAEQLDSHVKALMELRNQHSRGLEVQSTAGYHAREVELQLQEAIKGFTLRDYDGKDLNKRWTILGTQVKISEEHVNEAVASAEIRKVELEESLLKLNHLEGIVGELQRKANQFETEKEGIVEANFRFALELAAYENEMSEFDTTVKQILVEKEEISRQLRSSKKTTEYLKELLAAKGHKLQSQTS